MITENTNKTQAVNSGRSDIVPVKKSMSGLAFLAIVLLCLLAIGGMNIIFLLSQSHGGWTAAR